MEESTIKEEDIYPNQGNFNPVERDLMQVAVEEVLETTQDATRGVWERVKYRLQRIPAQIKNNEIYYPLGNLYPHRLLIGYRWTISDTKAWYNIPHIDMLTEAFRKAATINSQWALCSDVFKAVRTKGFMDDLDLVQLNDQMTYDIETNIGTLKRFGYDPSFGKSVNES